jgi:hypothetical protein
MALRKFLILRKLRSSRLEGRRALIQPVVDFLTPSQAGVHPSPARALKQWITGLRRYDGGVPDEGHTNNLPTSTVA